MGIEARGNSAPSPAPSVAPEMIYLTRDAARSDVFDYIEVFYNRTRRHSHLGGISPEAFELAAA